MRRVTVSVTDAGYAEAERQAAEVGRTVAQWIGWLVDTYIPAESYNPECDDGLIVGGYICPVCHGEGCNAGDQIALATRAAAVPPPSGEKQ